MKLKTILVSFLGATALAGSLIVPATEAQAATECAPGIGTKTPVVFVHGFREGPTAWGKSDDSTSMQNRIGKIGDIYPHLFDYEKWNTNWVTDKNIGARLANQISCMAESSRAEGGSGKVIVVAHSMGGNATRQAFAEDPSIKNDVGEVITIGTPNTGSDADQDLTRIVLNACGSQLLLPQGVVCTANIVALFNSIKAIPALATGSKEMKALPWWPNTVPVYAIAGNIRPTLSFLQLAGVALKSGAPSGTDGIVRVNSALRDVQTKGLGGTFEHVCVSPASLPMIGVNADCEHNHMLRSAVVQDKVVREIKRAIKVYEPAEIPALPSSPCPSADEIGGAVEQFLGAQGVEVSRTDTGEVQCADGWAVTGILTTIEGGGQTDGAVVLHRQGATWKVVDLGSELKGGTACEQAPEQVRTWMGC